MCCPGQGSVIDGDTPALAGTQGDRRAVELGMEYWQICPAPRLAHGGERSMLTDVGVLQEAADPSFSFQLLVI